MVRDQEPDELSPLNPDRPRGVLTKRERRYLIGESDIEPGTQDERSIRQSIRTHVMHSILDFTILYQALEERDRDRILKDGGDMGVVPWVSNSLDDMIAFIYQTNDHPELFAGRVEGGVTHAVTRDGWFADVEVDVKVTRSKKTSDVHDRLNSDGVESVTRQELETLFRAGRIDGEEFMQLMGKKRTEVDEE